MAYATTNPYTGEALKTFRDATDAEVEQAISGGTQPSSVGARPRLRSACDVQELKEEVRNGVGDLD
jgi:acyl-CoA reductase-like NAD-dependent aldehyde dehydrogenase